MPFRPKALYPAYSRLTRQFHRTSIHKVDDTNHYNTLQIPTNATAKDIKHSFYSLSKRHHPDHNPDDPEASKHFVKISEAYAVLGTPEKRLRYDRDVMRLGHATPHPHRGSYHSTGPAGGRPASGLSRRRTHFHGPPPSFYRGGGWGDQSAKRQAAHDDMASNASNTAYSAAGAGSTMGGGMGPGQQPFGHTSDVPHFDREGHRRTHEHQDIRRRRRSVNDFIPDQPPSGLLVNFFIVGGILVLTATVTTILYGRSTGKSKQDKRT